jgi:hypothetical protein
MEKKIGRIEAKVEKNIPCIFHGKINWQNRGKSRKK